MRLGLSLQQRLHRALLRSPQRAPLPRVEPHRAVWVQLGRGLLPLAVLLAAGVRRERSARGHGGCRRAGRREGGHRRHKAVGVQQRGKLQQLRLGCEGEADRCRDVQAAARSTA